MCVILGCMPRPANTQLIEQELLAAQGLKRCRKCRDVKSLGTFGVSRQSRDGLQTACKTCINKQNAKYEKASFERDPNLFRKRNREVAQRRRARNNAIDPEKKRARQRTQNLKRSYGITPEQYDQKIVDQNGYCSICLKELVPGLRTHLDHNHSTGQIRSILCGSCNIGLGAFGNNPKRLEAAVAYLVSWDLTEG